MCKCLLRKAAASALEFSVLSPPPYVYIHVSCVVRRIAPSRGRLYADVAGILRGKSRNDVTDFYAFVLQEVALG